ncbi:hypothetical protein E4T56_gene17136 [Termitomyces sp. T112]|nr:hypothetical protein E4T56_gene17136 [Termitomyces sp. T112]
MVAILVGRQLAAVTMWSSSYSELSCKKHGEEKTLINRYPWTRVRVIGQTFDKAACDYLHVQLPSPPISTYSCEPFWTVGVRLAVRPDRLATTSFWSPPALRIVFWYVPLPLGAHRDIKCFSGASQAKSVPHFTLQSGFMFRSLEDQMVRSTCKYPKLTPHVL